MQGQNLSGFAKRTGFPIFTLKRVCRYHDSTQSWAIPIIMLSKIVRDQTETGLSAKEAHKKYLTSNGYNPKREALRTWISVCATRSEILKAYYATEDGSDEERFAYAVMNEIFMEDLEKITTLKEATNMLKGIPRESGVERAVFLKMYELYKKEAVVVAQ